MVPDSEKGGVYDKDGAILPKAVMVGNPATLYVGGQPEERGVLVNIAPGVEESTPGRVENLTDQVKSTMSNAVADPKGKSAEAGASKKGDAGVGGKSTTGKKGDAGGKKGDTGVWADGW